MEGGGGIESEDATFFFNVTMQNHSGYAQGWRNLPRHIELPGNLKAADRTAEQFLDLMKESDLALEELIGYVLLVHLPVKVQILVGQHPVPAGGLIGVEGGGGVALAPGQYSSVDKPEDYSKELVLELMEEYPGVPADPENKPVNIVAQ